MSNPLRPIRPAVDPPAAADPIEPARRELRAAVDLVLSGRVTRVAIVNLVVSDAVLSDGLALAQAAGVGFEVIRPGGRTPLVRIGPTVHG